jgi:hypothetical protein
VALLFAAVPLTITPAAILGGLAAVMAGLHIFAVTSLPVVALYGLILTGGAAWGLWAALRPALSSRLGMRAGEHRKMKSVCSSNTNRTLMRISHEPGTFCPRVVASTGV